MKSENNLTITGIVITDVKLLPNQKYVRFRLVHNFGGGKRPLYLDCVLIDKPGSGVPHKGASIRVRAYLRMRGDAVEAVIKSFDIEN